MYNERQLLLERGADLEAKDEDGAILLHDACARGGINLKSCFIRWNLFVFLVEICDVVLLWMAISGFLEIVQLLLNRANDAEHIKRMLESVDSEGDTVRLLEAATTAMAT